jgi:alanine racemase
MVTNMPSKVQFEGRPVWAEVKLGALAHNLRAIQRRLASRRDASGARVACPKVLAVVKANAYGHGAVPIARALAKAGADFFGVTCSAEGIELREGGIRKPILLLTGFWEGEERRVIQHDLTPAVTRCEQLPLLERAAAKARRRAFSFHLKIDTGMNRMGISPSDVPCFAKTLANCPHLRLEGIFTHFASSEEFTHDKTEQQQQIFKAALKQLRELKVEAPLIHMANSAAVVSRPETWATMVRPGLILYGHHQSYAPVERDADAARLVPLRPVLALRARIISLRDIPPGQGVGYNSRWTASRPSRVAVIAIGYADGLPRGLTNKGRVIVRGQFAPLVGTVSMDLSAVDVTGVPNVRLGDVVTIYGSDGKASQQVSDVAKVLGTVTSDLCCDLGPRVPRIYLP